MFKMFLMSVGLMALICLSVVVIVVSLSVRKLRRDPYVRRWWVQESIADGTIVLSTLSPAENATPRIHNPDGMRCRESTIQDMNPYLTLYDPDPHLRRVGNPLGAA